MFHCIESKCVSLGEFQPAMMGDWQGLWSRNCVTCFHSRNALAGCSLSITTESARACRLKDACEGRKDCINFRPVAYRGIGGMLFGAYPWD